MFAMPSEIRILTESGAFIALFFLLLLGSHLGQIRLSKCGSEKRRRKSSENVGLLSNNNGSISLNQIREWQKWPWEAPQPN